MSYVSEFAFGAKEANLKLRYEQVYYGDNSNARNKAHRRGYVAQVEQFRLEQGE